MTITREERVADVFAFEPEFAVMTPPVLEGLVNGAEDLLDDHSDPVEVVGHGVQFQRCHVTVVVVTAVLQAELQRCLSELEFGIKTFVVTILDYNVQICHNFRFLCPNLSKFWVIMSKFVQIFVFYVQICPNFRF